MAALPGIAREGLALLAHQNLRCSLSRGYGFREIGGAMRIGWILSVFLAATTLRAAAPFALQGPGVNPADFRVTTFASGLGYPVGMAELSDGSLLVALSVGRSFGNSTGALVRLVDADGDGVADGPGTTLASGLPGGLTSLRVAGNLVFVTGQGAGKPITILRLGAGPSDTLTRVGAMDIHYPQGSWLHPHSALAVRESPGRPGSCDLIFQLGSQVNLGVTTSTASLSSSDIPGANGVLEGDSIYLVTLTDSPAGVTATNVTRLASGLRNAAGLAFQPETGDLYFQDNGIDGLVEVNEPTSADELNRIAAADIGGAVEDFGFPDNYTEYRTGRAVGGGGIQPLIAFQPLPDPQTGSESEGPNDIAFAPRGFPAGLNRGIFIGFHGRYGSGGLANEENPLVYADPATGHYFHFIGNEESGVGHLDGLLATADSLFAADMSPRGGLGANADSGVIYQIKAVAPPVLTFRLDAGSFELRWESGTLETAADLSEGWSPVEGASSPHSIPLDDAPGYYRVER